MALTYTADFKGQISGNDAIVSNTLTVSTGDFLTVAVVVADNAEATTFTISNTGTAITWTQQAATNTGSNAKVVLWSGIAGATPPTTVTVTATAGTFTGDQKALFVGVHTGAHATTPLPAGKIYSGIGGTGVTQSITPTASGSCLWMVCGDWGATNSFAAATNCTLVGTFHDAGTLTACAIRPTTQPRSDANVFTIGETDATTNVKIAWIAWEVQAASSGTQTLTPSLFSNSNTFYSQTVVALFPRYARPSADITNGTWTPSTGVDLYAVLDEASADDADYITATSLSTCQIRLAPVIDPGTSSGQVVKYRAKSTTGSSLIVRLKQGATTIATATHNNLPNSWADYSMTLSAGECDSITDYTDLRIEFESANGV